MSRRHRILFAGRSMNHINIYIILSIQLLVASATHIVAKAVLADLDASSVMFMRSLVASSGLMLLIWLRRGRLKIARADWRSIAMLGFLGVLINQFCYLYGMKFTTAANGALLYASTPVFVLVLSHFILKERMTSKKLIGITLAFVGIVLVIFERGVDFSSGYAFGNLLVLVGVVAWALFTILGKPTILKYGSLIVTTAMMLAGTAMFFPFGAYAAAHVSYGQLTSLHWAGILYLGLGTSVVGYVLWYHALGRIEVSKVAVFANGQPLLATLLSFIFLDYTITGTFIVGGVITIVGVIMTQFG